ncbi:MAG TPA: rRNA maturation RNase YbeY [Tepidisphaeraceae bacterium]|nr:rRNA maturation RNase YbeY [Tepidisphaeraceae bacterium]
MPPPRRFRLHASAEVGRPLLPKIRPLLKRAHAILADQGKTKVIELSIALVGDATMSRLHERDLKIAGPTDVLTYELDHDAGGTCVAGEVVVCVPEARRQATSRGTDVASEVLLYALHGLLHLSGFDDRTARAYRTMHRTEDAILSQLGVGPVFAPPPPAARPPKAKRRSTLRPKAR